MSAKNFFLYLGLILIFILIVINIIFHFFIFLEYDYQNNLILSEIDKSINGKLIESIEFRKSCHGDEEKLILGFWDGTNEGCDCDRIVYKGMCSDKQISNGCTSLYSNPPINYTIINSSHICAKMSKYNYIEILKKNKVITKEEICPENYKPCGILDTLGKILCLSINESCPINSITLREKFNDFFNLKKSFDIDYYYYNLFNDNETNVHLISQIKLSQYLHCISPFEKFWDYHYILEPPDQRCITEINGKLYDERYQSIFNHSISKFQLYNENSIIGRLKDIDVVSLNKINEDEVYFFSRNFLGFEYKELAKSEFNYDNLIYNQNLVNGLNNIQKYFIYVIGISFVIMIIFIFDWCEEIPKLPVIGGIFKKEAIEYLSSLIFLISFFISPLFYLTIFIIILICSKKIRSILNIKGGDNFTSKLIEIYLKQNISTNINYSIAIIIFCVFIIFVFILIIILFKLKKKKRTLSKNDLILGAYLLGTLSRNSSLNENSIN